MPYRATASTASTAAVSDAAAVKAAVVGTPSSAAMDRQKSQQQRLLMRQRLRQQRVQQQRAATSCRQFDGSEAVRPALLWLNHTRRHGRAQRTAAGIGRQDDDRPENCLGFSTAIPLAANNSATQAKRSPADSAPAQPEEGEGTPQKVSSEEIVEGKPMAENRRLELANSMSRRLRQRLTPQLQSLRGATVEASMNLVKLHRHPAQLEKERLWLETLGVSQSEQIVVQNRHKIFLSKARKDSLKHKKEGGAEQKSVSAADYPDWIPFKLRIRRSRATELWSEFVLRRREMSKQLGEKALKVVKASERYNESYIDVWTRTVTVQARPASLLHDLVRPVLTRLGLDNRADLRLTASCFAGDIRQGGERIRGLPKTAVDMSLLTPIASLYEAGIKELFVSPWPGIRTGFPEGYFDKPVSQPPVQAAATGGSDNNSGNNNLLLVRQHLRDSQLAAAQKLMIPIDS